MHRIDELQERVEQRLAQVLGEWEGERGDLAPLVDAIEYPLLAGGKRIRPVLLLAAADCCGLAPDDVVDIAVSVEMIHTYSLVHDDLPSMDDDDLRRGIPTSHRVHGEGVAILVGDALQAEAFRLIAGATVGTDAQRLEAVAVLSRAGGWRGMVGGQYLDIAGASTADVDALRRLHGRKTGALIEASVEIGAIVAGANEPARESCRVFARELGWLFQLVDDLLDVIGETATIGKRPGSDRRAGKVTAVEVFGGVDALQHAADDQLDRCLAIAASLPEAGGTLPDIARFVRRRDR